MIRQTLHAYLLEDLRRRRHCDDGIDNDGDGLTDNEDNDCDPGGPGGTTGPGNQLAQGGSSDNDANSETLMMLTLGHLM